MESLTPDQTVAAPLKEVSVASGVSNTVTNTTWKSGMSGSKQKWSEEEGAIIDRAFEKFVGGPTPGISVMTQLFSSGPENLQLLWNSKDNEKKEVKDEWKQRMINRVKSLCRRGRK